MAKSSKRYGASPRPQDNATWTRIVCSACGHKANGPVSRRGDHTPFKHRHCKQGGKWQQA